MSKKKNLLLFVLSICMLFLSTSIHIAHAQTTQNTGNFVPLTNLPVFGTNTITAPDFPTFFNALYKYAIGIAATLAVLQIMYAGIMYMGSDSGEKTSQAREKVQWAVLGLVLVLSPVIVFSIINPKILSLNVGFSALTPSGTSSAGATATTPVATTPAKCTAVINSGDIIPQGCSPTDCTTQHPGWTVTASANTQQTQYRCVQPGNVCNTYPSGTQTQLPIGDPQQTAATQCCNTQSPAGSCHEAPLGGGGKNSNTPYCFCN